MHEVQVFFFYFFYKALRNLSQQRTDMEKFQCMNGIVSGSRPIQGYISGKKRLVRPTLLP